MTSVVDAIRESVHRDCTVALAWSEGVEVDLLCAADDSSDPAPGERLYWGVTDTGWPWRVRVTGQP